MAQDGTPSSSAVPGALHKDPRGSLLPSPQGQSPCPACAMKTDYSSPAAGTSAVELVRPDAALGEVGKHVCWRTVCGPGKPLKARNHEDILNTGIIPGKQARGGRGQEPARGGVTDLEETMPFN